VGCNYPGSSAALNGCVNDTDRWRDTLQKRYGFQDILRLADQNEADWNKQPTRNNMINAVRWLVDGAERGDCLVFQFSGHGGQKPSDDPGEEDGQDEVLIPTDYKEAGTISDNELYDLMVVPLSEGVKLTVILDCCHSGSALDLPFDWNREGGSWNEAPHAWHTSGDVQMFSGCEDSQCSMDASRHGKAAGAMTTALCDVIEQTGGGVSYTELLDGLHEVLQSRNFDQRPKLSSSQAFGPQDKPFSFSDGIVPNMNAQLGQDSAPPPRPPRANAQGFAW